MKRIVLIGLSGFILVMVLVFRIVIKNDCYIRNMKKSISEHYKGIDDYKDIVSINRFNDYYIVGMDNSVVVLDKKYKRVTEYNNVDLVDDALNSKIIYMDDMVLFVKDEKVDSGLIYNYYDVKSGEMVKSLEVGRR